MIGPELVKVFSENFQVIDGYSRFIILNFQICVLAVVMFINVKIIMSY